jgi:hypothetical protein
LSTAVKLPKRLVMFSNRMKGTAEGSVQGENLRFTGPSVFAIRHPSLSKKPRRNKGADVSICPLRDQLPVLI